MSFVVTSQPTASPPSYSEVSTVVQEPNEVVTTQPTPVLPEDAATVPEDAPNNENVPEHDDEEEEERKRQKKQEECCFVCDDFDEDDGYLCYLLYRFLCNPIGHCCNNIGQCTDSMCESCGDCLHNCCETSNHDQNDGCCSGCCDGDGGCCDGDGGCCDGDGGCCDGDCDCGGDCCSFD